MFSNNENPSENTPESLANLLDRLDSLHKAKLAMDKLNKGPGNPVSDRDVSEFTLPQVRAWSSEMNQSEDLAEHGSSLSKLGLSFHSREMSVNNGKSLKSEVYIEIDDSEKFLHFLEEINKNLDFPQSQITLAINIKLSKFLYFISSLFYEFADRYASRANDDNEKASENSQFHSVLFFSWIGPEQLDVYSKIPNGNFAEFKKTIDRFQIFYKLNAISSFLYFVDFIHNKNVTEKTTWLFFDLTADFKGQWTCVFNHLKEILELKVDRLDEKELTVLDIYRDELKKQISDFLDRQIKAFSTSEEGDTKSSSVMKTPSEDPEVLKNIKAKVDFLKSIKEFFLI